MARNWELTLEEFGFESLHVVVFFPKEFMLKLEAYALMEMEKMMKLGTCFLLMFSIPDCFEFCFQFTIEMIMVQIWIVYHFDRFDRFDFL